MKDQVHFRKERSWQGNSEKKKKRYIDKEMAVKTKGSESHSNSRTCYLIKILIV